MAQRNPDDEDEVDSDFFSPRGGLAISLGVIGGGTLGAGIAGFVGINVVGIAGGYAPWNFVGIGVAIIVGAIGGAFGGAIVIEKFAEMAQPKGWSSQNWID